MLLVFFLLNVAAIVALPHDKYLRYQTLDDGDAPRAYWIYERIHFDRTPIDVAFVGSSRTGLGVHSRRLEDDLARRGIHARAVNLYQTRSGVNIQYVIAKELLTTRKVKLLVLEMTESEARTGHDNFAYLADASDILTAPVLINTNYFADLLRLPSREVKLFVETELSGLRLYWPDFVPPTYEGPNLDHAEFIQNLDGRRRYRDLSHSRNELEAMRAQEDARVTPPLLPSSLGEFEYRVPRYYEERMLELAAAAHTPVVFLYVPRFEGPSYPSPCARYAGRADLINPWVALRDDDIWGDQDHVNWQGAQRLTDYVADALASRSELQ